MSLKHIRILLKLVFIQGACIKKFLLNSIQHNACFNVSLGPIIKR
jgi:hypothetical protein